MTRLERFNAKYRVDPVSGCWEWTAAKYYNGYGVFVWSKGENQTAHRASWRLHRGEVADEMDMCHHCDNKGCVNPEHLFVGTRQENMMDRVRKGRHPRISLKGEANGNSKLTDAVVLSIRTSTTSQRAMARELGVSLFLISQIRTRKIWKHVP
jgi:hypothetical protein